MSRQTKPSTFTLQLDQLLRGEVIQRETPDLAFARRLLGVDVSPRSQIEISLRARLLTSKNPQPFPQVPMNSLKRPSPLPRLAPTLAFGAAMLLLVWFLAWILTNTTPQPAVNATETPSPVPVLEKMPGETVTVLPEETPTEISSTDDPLTVLQTLTAKYANDILSGSGWLHIVQRVYRDGDSGVMPNGQAVPNPNIADDWYFLDDQKQVVQAVNIQADENGTPIQVSVLRDRQWVNLTLDFTFPAKPFIPNLDAGFTVRAADLIANGGTLQMSDFYFEGNFVGIRFSYVEDDVEVEGIFDENTGQMLSFTGTFIEEQEKQIIYSITVIAQERTPLPPANILAYVDQDPTSYVPSPPTGTPTPEGFDASKYTLSFVWVNGDHALTPQFFYGDIYANGYILGRVNFGNIPGGWCDRSSDGHLIAFNYDVMEPEYRSSLHWFSLDDLMTIHEPLPDLQQLSPPVFAPNSLQLAFGALQNNESGIYIYDLQTESLRRISNTGSFAPPAWSPDGQYIAYLLPVDDENFGHNQVSVIQIETGEIIYTGDQYAEDSPLRAWGTFVPTSKTGGCDSSSGPAPESSANPPENPPSSNTNPALSSLSFKYVFNPDGSAPEIYLADVYAGDMYVGRTDFGEIPGGLCDRSWNGVLLAFTYAKDEDTTLRWVSIKDVTRYEEVSGYTLHSPVTFAPNDFRLTFVGCKGEDCGIFVKDLETNAPVIKLSDGDAYGRPAWSPDGQYIIIWYGEPINANGIENIKVVHAETGEVLYMGDPTLDASPLQAWNISPMYRPMTSTERCEAAPDNLPASASLAPDGTYTVQEGDTLAGIANHFGMAIEILRSLNGLSSDTVLHAGQVLLVFPPPTNVEPEQPTLNPDGTYTVQDGDTLNQIAYDFGLTVETLIALNSLDPEAPAIFPGQVLIVVPPETNP